MSISPECTPEVREALSKTVSVVKKLQLNGGKAKSAAVKAELSKASRFRK